MPSFRQQRITMLCGGVGGARAALALYENHAPENLVFVVNTGDDFTHLGLEIWPDWDTVVYHLANLCHPLRGWGRVQETKEVMTEFSNLGGDSWFELSDQDLALQLLRTGALADGASPSEVEEQLCSSLGLRSPVHRCSLNGLKTELKLTTGEVVAFQDWFVRQQAKPEVAEVLYSGSKTAQLNPWALAALKDCDLLLLAPSNPYLSLFPMLACPALSQAVKSRKESVWAVSPLIEGKAVKGPLDRLLASLSSKQGQEAIAWLLQEWAQRLLLPRSEVTEVPGSPMNLSPCRTRLTSSEDRGEFYQDLTELWEGR